MNKNRQKGVTLVELLISIVIFGIISAAVMMTMTGSMRTSLTARNLNDMTQSINNVFDIIRRDLELAGNHVMGGLYIPNNTPNEIDNGFDTAGCRNNLASNVNVRDMSNNLLGVIPAGTDTIAFAFTRSAGDINLLCSTLSGFIPPVDLTEDYTAGSNTLKVDDADNFRCYMDENAQRPVFAIIIDNSPYGLAELFTVASASGNDLAIANDGFSNGGLSMAFNEGSRVWLLGPNPNAGKIEFFILEWDRVNPRDPNTPLRSLVKRINNREIYPIADNITNMQIKYILKERDETTNRNIITDDLTTGVPAGVQIELTVRSDDMIMDSYIEETYTALISIKGTIYDSSRLYDPDPAIGKRPYFP